MNRPSSDLVGVVTGVYDIAALLNRAVDQAPGRGLHLALDLTEASTTNTVYDATLGTYNTVRWYHGDAPPALTQTWRNGDTAFTARVSAAGPPFLPDVRGTLAVFLVGLLLTLGVVEVYRRSATHERYISELARQRANQLVRLKRFDATTGLPNRACMIGCLGEAVSSARNERRRTTLCHIDIDQFRVINDIGGHSAGDELLRLVSRVIAGLLASNDCLARLGADEFALLLRDREADEAESFANRICAEVAATRFHWAGRVFPVTVSIGMVNLGEREGEPEVNELLGEISAACQLAKDNGRNRINRFRRTQSTYQEHRDRIDALERVTRALEQDGFSLYEQAIMPAPADAPEHTPRTEILLRLEDPERGTLTPGTFLPTAERYGLMPRIDRWVLRAALPRLAVDHHGNSQWFINLSGQTLDDPSFCELVEAMLREHDVAPARLCFEITESAAISDLSNTRLFLRRLQALGCQFALDDFGSGMSSFRYLKHLPVNYLKIDGAFIRELDRDPADRVFVQAMTTVAAQLGMRTIGEFVETEAVQAEAAHLGLDLLQGYYIARPQPLGSGA